MKIIETKIIIDAPIALVWEVFSDFSAYPNWNPFLKKVSGKPEVGARLEILPVIGKGKPTRFTPRVLKVEAEQEFRWLGHLFVRGIFDGEHYFKFRALSNQQTEFVHGEQFRGVISPLLLKMIGSDTKVGFEAMNKALKEKTETIYSKNKN